MTTDNGTSRQLQVKDDDGLTLQQRGLLQEMAMNPGDWREACANAEVLPATCQSWLQTIPAFRDAYNNLIGPALQIAQDQIEGLTMKAAGMYDEALEAVNLIEREFNCVRCNELNTVEVPIMDWNTRLKAGDTVLKVSRLLINRSETTNVDIHLNAEEAMAWAAVQWAIRSNKPITVAPSMLMELKKKGKVWSDPSSSKVHDASDGGVLAGD